jgi:hypothetical protein
MRSQHPLAHLKILRWQSAKALLSLKKKYDKEKSKESYENYILNPII